MTDTQFWPALAQQAANLTQLGGLGQLIAQFGVLGILAWYLWYRTSVADPKQQKAFSEAQEKQAASHKEQYAKLVEETTAAHQKCEEKFEQLIQESRAESREQLDKLHEMVREERESKQADLQAVLQRFTGQ
tara:strand:+ start:4860 stop:5255 length:396 start_codon:yes stop_codon:yes gene_type:complete